MDNYKEKLNEISCLVETKLKSFDNIDFGVLGITLLSIGSLFGGLKKEMSKKFAPILTVISVLGSIYLFLKFSKKDSVPYIKNTK